jgi:hypothetical protein
VVLSHTVPAPVAASDGHARPAVALPAHIASIAVANKKRSLMTEA